LSTHWNRCARLAVIEQQEIERSCSLQENVVGGPHASIRTIRRACARLKRTSVSTAAADVIRVLTFTDDLVVAKAAGRARDARLAAAQDGVVH
jgi:hypothetical protein